MKNHWFSLEINDFHGFGGDFWRFSLRFEATNIILDAGSGHGWLLQHLWKNEFFKIFRRENFSWLRAWFVSEIPCLATSHNNRKPFSNARSWISDARAQKCLATRKNFRVGKIWKIHFFITIAVDVPEYSQRPEWCLAPHRFENPQKYHSEVVKSLISLAKAWFPFVRTSPIKTGHSRHAYSNSRAAREPPDDETRVLPPQ